MIQVIAFENEGWMSPINYEYSPTRTFKTSQQNSDDYFGFDDKANEGIEANSREDDTNKEDQELNGGISTNGKDHASNGGTEGGGKPNFLSKPGNRKKGWVEDNFFLITIGGCLAGIILMVVLITIFGNQAN